LVQIDGFVFTIADTDVALLVLKVKAGLRIYIGNERYGLRKINMDGFIQRKVLIKLIGHLDRADLYTGPTPRATIFNDVSWFFCQGDLKISGLSFDTINFCVCQNLYIGVSAAFNKLWRLNTHGAVVGRKGLVQLRHLSANGR